MLQTTTILMLEDHVETRRIVAYLLRRLGYTVIEAGTVSEGIANVGVQSVALLDFHLPDGFGTEVLKQIRKQTHYTRVAFITAAYDPETLHHLTAMSADAVFRKPVDFKAILDWINIPVGHLTAAA